jgi:hypothetical protein
MTAVKCQICQIWGSHNGEYNDYFLQRCDAMLSAFWTNLLPPPSGDGQIPKDSNHQSKRWLQMNVSHFYGKKSVNRRTKKDMEV